MQLILKLFRYLIVFIIFPAVLIYIPYTHIYTLFRGEFTQYLGSIEVSYIQMAKFISSSLPNFSWQPKWYLGYPMAVFYTPFVPFAEYLGNIFFGWSYSHAYRVITAIGYIGSLAGIYFFGRTLFKSSVSGFISALIYGLCPSLIAFLYSEVAVDRFMQDFIEPRRYTILVRWGEGPHIVSLLFLPLACLFLLKFLRSGLKWWLLPAALLSGLVAMTNTVGVWGLGILLLAILFGQISENFSYWFVYLKRLIIFGIITYGLIAFWFNPIFLSTFLRESGGTITNWQNMLPWGLVIVIGILAAYLFLSAKLLKNFSGGGAVIFFFAVMFWLVNTYYASGEERIQLVPQVLRLNTEVDLAFGLLIGFLVSLLAKVLAKREFLKISVMAGVLGIAVALLLPVQMKLARELPAFTLPLEETNKNLQETAEYEVAKTLEGYVKNGERVFVSGNYSFFLDYFTDLPQLRGALFQSAVHPWAEHIYYQVVTGEDPVIALNLLKIANVGWLVVSGPRDSYQDFKYPDKFKEVLNFIKDQNGDLYYGVPLKNASLVKAVPKNILKNPVPKNAIDAEPIAKYVTLLEESNNQLLLKEKENGHYQITGNTGETELVLVQMSYVPGWQARDSLGQKLSVSSDPMGYIIIMPKKSGLQEIQLNYRPSLSIVIFRLITVITVVILFIIFLIKKDPFGKEPQLLNKPDQQIDEEE